MMGHRVHQGPHAGVTSEPGEGPSTPGPEGKNKSIKDGMRWSLEHRDTQEQGWDGLWDGNVGNGHRNRNRAVLGSEEVLGMGWNGEKWGQRAGRGGMGLGGTEVG